MKMYLKKLLTNYLLKKFNEDTKSYYYLRDNVKYYHFLRWLVTLVANKEDEDFVFSGIAKYFAYPTSITDLPFTDIFVIGKVVCIRTHRPGRWIGKSGSTINEITDCINLANNGEPIADYEIRLIEDTKGATTRISGFVKFYLEY